MILCSQYPAHGGRRAIIVQTIVKQRKKTETEAGQGKRTEIKDRE